MEQFSENNALRGEAGSEVVGNSAPDVAIAITTYNRRDLLRVLLESIRSMTVQPSAIFMIDNENSPATKALADEFNVEHYIGMEENTGGAGGFSRGVEEAYHAGHEWIWVMDDDVSVEPNALERLEVWASEAEKQLHAGKTLSETATVFQCRKYNWDGSLFYWQYHFWNKLGIPNPFAPSAFGDEERSREMNTMCFEGSMFHRDVVKAIGLPDARFFIYWDDTVYGYLASKVTKMLVVNEVIMRRTRPLKNVKLGSVRKLNSTSNMSRYHIMRNRGHMAHYLMEHGDYNPVVFAFGTFLTLCKETIRLFVSREVKSGFPKLTEGMRDGKDIRKDKSWMPFSQVHPL